MAMMTGEIKNISVDDGQVKAYCETGNGPSFTAVIPQLGGDFHPIPGDIVTASKIGQEWIAFSVCCKDSEVEAGEHLIFSRDTAGEVVATIHAKADGTVEIRPTSTCSIGNGTDYVAMSTPLNTFLTSLSNAVAPGGTPVVTPAPGAVCPVAAAIYAAIMASFNSQTAQCGSTNLKAE
jgi:hypothetical protein